ncbi:class C sortase [Leucobacter chinensis]|uniref:class C sortase n=1 Tax=Leucobacter chinensis TaxID=2851010 RepID=UPI001C2267B7|nr:class C sortase [Leucobacter chinensis]
MTTTFTTRRERRYQEQKIRTWRPALLTWIMAVTGLTGMIFLLYPTASAWLSQYNQSQLIRDYGSSLQDVQPDAKEQLRLAKEYNDQLVAGVLLEENANVPTGTGTGAEGLDYQKLLIARDDGMMSRLIIPGIDVDIPVYHGTDDDTLKKGAGHLEGSHLPIGGVGTHSVITAHRGLASARMFTDLDQVDVGDTFTLSTFGEVLTYQVTETKVVEPDQTDSLRAVADKDMVTLITCTPLGVNSHRILVTAERISPTPESDLRRANDDPYLPHFPWWLVLLMVGTTGLAGYTWRAGYTDAAVTARKAQHGHLQVEE